VPWSCRFARELALARELRVPVIEPVTLKDLPLDARRRLLGQHTIPGERSFNRGPQFTQFTGEELQVKFLSDSQQSSLKY